MYIRVYIPSFKATARAIKGAILKLRSFEGCTLRIVNESPDDTNIYTPVACSRVVVVSLLKIQ